MYPRSLGRDRSPSAARSPVGAFGLTSLAVMLAACASARPPGVEVAPAPVRAAQVVNATILTNGCEALGKPSAKLAERAMSELVEGCGEVPGGSARFGATLLPGGHIKIEGVAGQPDVVPICILKHSLVHRVPLERPCHLDVSIAQSTVPMPPAAAATAAAAR